MENMYLKTFIDSYGNYYFNMFFLLIIIIIIAPGFLLMDLGVTSIV